MKTSSATATAATASPEDQADGVRRRRGLTGRRAAMVVFSYYPSDPRPRRAAETLVGEGMEVDLICLRDGQREAKREIVNGVHILRLPLARRRGGTLGYVLQYVSFVVAAGAVLALRSCRRRYDLVHVHNMPDVLVISALVPRARGAKVILDLHDPMPELMMTIFGLGPESGRVRALKWLEKWSIGRADVVLTVNRACQRLFGGRSCCPDKIRVVMNSPDEAIFRLSPPRLRAEKPFVIMYHGSLVERNGLDLAVKAVSRLGPLARDLELRIYGPSTPFLEQVMASVRTQGLQGSVTYAGPRSLEGIVEAIEDCDVGIVPNQRNIFTELNTPTRIFEYLAGGKPVIAPRAAGILDYFSEDELILFTLGDEADLARCMRQAYLDRAQALESARQGQKILRAHSWSRERAVLVEVVEQLLRGRAEARHA